MEAIGLSLPAVIEHHIVPLLHWNETKFAQHEGKFTDHVTVANGAIRLGAVEKAFRLLGAYPSEDPVLNSKISVDVIIADMPRPKYGVQPIDIKPTVRPPRKELNAPAPAIKPAAPSDNGAKPDPRPKD